MAIALAVACASTGCDKLFSLQHVDQTPGDGNGDGNVVDGKQIDAGMPPDASCGSPGSAATVVLGARAGGQGQASMQDTYVVGDTHMSRNFGAAPTLALCERCDANGTVWDASQAVSLLRFDTGAVCPGSTVTSATLYLDTTGDQLGSGDVGVFVVRQAWTEGMGYDQDGAANWVQRTQTALWAAPGVGVPARDSVPIATFAPLDKATTYPINIPPTIVQGWLTNTGSNNGLALVITNGMSDVQFYSRDGGMPAQRPGLEVHVTLP